jgi:hypothetical protein
MAAPLVESLARSLSPAGVAAVAGRTQIVATANCAGLLRADRAADVGGKVCRISPFCVLGLLDRGPDASWRRWHLDMPDAQRRQRVTDGIDGGDQ